MDDSARFRLLATYTTPIFQIGDIVSCEIRGDVVLTGLSFAPIHGRQEHRLIASDPPRHPTGQAEALRKSLGRPAALGVERPTTPRVNNATLHRKRWSGQRRGSRLVA
jgi:hypothetical protein